jgi:hypothetical protein
MKEVKYFIAATISQGEIFRSGVDSVFKQNGIKTLQLVDIAVIEAKSGELFYEINKEFDYSKLSEKAKEYVQELYRESVVKPARQKNESVSCEIKDFNKEQGISMAQMAHGLREFCKTYGTELESPLSRFIGWQGTSELVALNLIIGSDLGCDMEYKTIEQTKAILDYRAFSFILNTGLSISYAQFLHKKDYYVAQFKNQAYDYPKLTDAPFVISKAINIASQYNFLESNFLFKRQSQN